MLRRARAHAWRAWFKEKLDRAEAEGREVAQKNLIAVEICLCLPQIKPEHTADTQPMVSVG
jgi:hypothetical protein